MTWQEAAETQEAWEAMQEYREETLFLVNPGPRYETDDPDAYDVEEDD